jgi:hypothetical protein
VGDAEEVVRRVRAHGLGKPKPVPPRRGRRPNSAVIVQATNGSSDGVSAASVLGLTVGRVLAETLVYAGEVPDRELCVYVTEHRALVVPGGRRRIEVIGLPALGRMLRDRGYRKGHAVVAADLGGQISALADHWAPGRDPGVWSFGLPGLGHWVGKRWVKFPDAPRVIGRPVGERVLFAWGTTASDAPVEGKRRHRPPPRRGPFVDVLTLTAALAGRDRRPDLGEACRLFGIQVDELGVEPLDRLRADAHAIAALYTTLAAEVRAMRLGLDPASLVSTGGIASAILREAGIEPLA